MRIEEQIRKEIDEMEALTGKRPQSVVLSSYAYHKLRESVGEGLERGIHGVNVFFGLIVSVADEAHEDRGEGVLDLRERLWSVAWKEHEAMLEVIRGYGEKEKTQEATIENMRYALERAEEMIAKKDRELAGRSGRERWREYFKALISSGEGYTLERCAEMASEASGIEGDIFGEESCER